ncbi:hypothetical protein HGRIS_000136 [Hohenbuehelia grisea]
MPRQNAWVEWVSHKALYGPISSMKVLGQHFIILNDLQTSIDLLDKRSSIYSGRPTFTFAGEMIGWDRQVIMSQYGERFRTMRKLLKGFIGSKVSIVPFQPVQELETRYFLARLLDDPSSLIANIRLTAGAIALQISHGYRIETHKPDPLVDLVETAAKEFYIATYPGRWVVDGLPFLKKLPRWLPGTGFFKVADVFREHNMAQANVPHNFVKRKLADGTAVSSFTSSLLRQELNPETEDALKWAANAVFGGGSDPSTAVIATFFLIMTLYPDVQKKAQEELDSVVGTHKLPTFADRERLPYCEAILKEMLRWHPVGRLCIPHRVLEDDVYNNYFIPKGSIVFAHMWNITRDPLYYTDVETFKPERFLGKEPELDPNTYIYGFGRRGCPGQDLGNATMFLTIAMVLSVFNITKAKDASGREIEPIVKFGSGTVSHPEPFEYDVKARSKEAELIIRQVYEEHPPLPSDGPYLR